MRTRAPSRGPAARSIVVSPRRVPQLPRGIWARAGSVDADPLRDIAQLRTFLSGPGVLALFDAPWLPIYLLLIALMHPMLGIAATVGAIVLVSLGARSRTF